MTTRIAIDPNVRVRGNGTYATFDDVEGELVVGGPVEVYEPEAGLSGRGAVTEIDSVRSIVYLSVDWASLWTGDRSHQDVSTLDDPDAESDLSWNDQSVTYAGPVLLVPAGWGESPFLPGGYYLPPFDPIVSPAPRQTQKIVVSV